MENERVVPTSKLRVSDIMKVRCYVDGDRNVVVLYKSKGI